MDLACQGYAQATRLYRLQDTFQKSAHAPVLLDDPILGEPLVVAIVTVSGSPDFFDALTLLRRGAFATGAAVLVVLVLMGAVLYRLNLAVERYRARVMHQENLAAMGRMTAGIAHEIRNPLGIIRGAGQHLQRVLQDANIDEPVARVHSRRGRPSGPDPRRLSGLRFGQGGGQRGLRPGGDRAAQRPVWWNRN